MFGFILCLRITIEDFSSPFLFFSTVEKPCLVTEKTPSSSSHSFVFAGHLCKNLPFIKLPFQLDRLIVGNFDLQPSSKNDESEKLKCSKLQFCPSAEDHSLNKQRFCSIVLTNEIYKKYQQIEFLVNKPIYGQIIRNALKY